MGTVRPRRLCGLSLFGDIVHMSANGDKGGLDVSVQTYRRVMYDPVHHDREPQSPGGDLAGEILPGDRWRVPVALPVVAQNKQQPSAIPAKGKI